MRTAFIAIGLALSVALLTACNSGTHLPPAAPQGQWISIFNGKNLDGWTAKIAGHEAGENYANTFRVENGVLRVAYDQYGQFNNEFGGLYFNQKLSRYWVRVEYRFVGDLAAGAPQWASRDSGIMMHTQSPNSMDKNQQFPVSVELNMLGARLRSRPTGDVCTNSGMRVVIDGGLLADQCSHVSSTTMRGDQWVIAEAEVLGNTSIKHYVDGKLIVEYRQPQLDEKIPEAAKLLASGAKQQVEDGYLALQSNGQPIEFRKVEILPLTEPVIAAK